MHILIHGINFAPELTGIGKYTGEMAEWLAARLSGAKAWLHVQDFEVDAAFATRSAHLTGRNSITLRYLKKQRQL